MTSQNSVLLLCSDDSQDPRLLHCRDPVAYSPTSRGCVSPLPPLSLPIRPPPPPFPVHLPGLPTHHRRPRNPADNPPRFPRAIPRHLFCRNGLLLRRSNHRLLVRHELERAHGKKYWQRVDDRFREYGWDCGDFLLPGQRCSLLPRGLFDMYGSDVPRGTGCRTLWRISDLGEQERTEERWKGKCEEVVLVTSRSRSAS